MSESTIDRRALLKTAGVAAVGFAASTYAAGRRRKYVNVGVGSRSRMYLTAITKTFAEGNELVGICDTNPGRLDVAAAFVAPNGAKPKKYLAADFDKMMKDRSPTASSSPRPTPSTTTTSCARWTPAATASPRSR